MLRFAFETNGPAIFVTESALKMMLKYRQLKSHDLEAGGQLFATFKGQDTYIEYATSPKPLDKRRRYSFEPNRFLQRLEIAAMYCREKHFVGDWHTHPETIPSPSVDDKRSTDDIFKQSRHDLKALLLIIVGTAEPPECVRMYFVNHYGIREMMLMASSQIG